MYTKQQIFDQVARAIIAQGKPSVDNTQCLYRAPDGCKCAAGHLIPDDEYDPDMENIQASWVAGRPPEDAVGVVYDRPISTTLQKIVDETSIEFVNRLQSCHDIAADKSINVPFLEEYCRIMRVLAADMNLNAEVLDA
jgi:hypothetical protein